MGEKPKTQEFVYIVAVNKVQGDIDKMGFTEFINSKREELKKQFESTQVSILVVSTKIIYSVVIKKAQADVDAEGFMTFLSRRRDDLKKQFASNQVFVIAV